MSTPFILFDFTKDSIISSWRVIDDGVMGGKSKGNFSLNEEGIGIFKGQVSLANNGGFSSVRYRFKPKDISSYNTFVIRLKGDGKLYQFRAKSNIKEAHSYIAKIPTTGDWQTIKIPMDTMYPAFRGRSLNISNYKGALLEEVAFLIGNKKEEKFRLEIDYIELYNYE